MPDPLARVVLGAGGEERLGLTAAVGCGLRSEGRGPANVRFQTASSRWCLISKHGIPIVEFANQQWKIVGQYEHVAHHGNEVGGVLTGPSAYPPSGGGRRASSRVFFLDLLFFSS